MSKEYQVRTPMLKTVAEGTLQIFSQAVAGIADLKQGQLAVSAGSSVRRAIETDLRVRLAASRLSEVEGAASAR